VFSLLIDLSHYSMYKGIKIQLPTNEQFMRYCIFYVKVNHQNKV